MNKTCQFLEILLIDDIITLAEINNPLDNLDNFKHLPWLLLLADFLIWLVLLRELNHWLTEAYHKVLLDVEQSDQLVRTDDLCRFVGILDKNLPEKLYCHLPYLLTMLSKAFESDLNEIELFIVLQLSQVLHVHAQHALQHRLPDPILRIMPPLNKYLGAKSTNVLIE